MARTCIRCRTEISERHKLARMCCACASDNFNSPLMRQAHLEVSRARIRGDLPNPSTLKCVDCGAPACQYDHREYAKPLEVDAVCRSCNVRRGPAIDSKAWDTSPVKGRRAAIGA